MFNATVTDRTPPAPSALDLEMDAFGSCAQNMENSTRLFTNRKFCGHMDIWNQTQIYFYYILDFIRFVFVLINAYGTTVLYSVVLLITLYVLYKSYISPVVITKELTDVGFDHITGPNRKSAVLRAQRARRLGSRLPPPYPNGWFALLESEELRVGEAVAVDALGVNLCVFRSAEGVARCVDAYCPHLGANMAAGGAVVGDCVQCPFHKWRFSGESGACVAVPDLEKPPRGVGVRAWATRECAGAVWVWHDAAGAAPAWSLPPAGRPSWACRGRNHYTVGSHIQDIPENGADVAHLNSVHSTSLLTRLGEKYPFLLNFVGRHVWSAEWSRGATHVAHMSLQHEYRIGKLSLGHISIEADQIGPGAVYLHVTTAAGPLLIVQSVTPLSPCEQRVVHRVFSPSRNAPIAAAFVYAESAMFERDLAIWNSKRFVHNPVYVRTDKSIRAFRAWYSQFYSESSLSFQEAMKGHRDPLDW